MALALLVYRNGPEEMQSQKSSLFFYVGGMAAITIIVNATTSNIVLTKLDLIGVETAEKRMVMASMHKKLKKEMRAALAELASEFNFSEMEVEEVRQSVSLLSDVSIDEINRDISEVRAVYAKKAAARRPLSSSRPEQPANGSPSRTDFIAPDNGNGRSGSVTNPMHTGNSGSPQPYAKVPRPPSPDAQDSTTQHKPTLTRRAVQSVPFHDDEEEAEPEEEEPFDVIQRLESGHNYRGPTSTFSRTRGNTKGILHRSLSMAARDPEHIPSPQLLAYVRSTFLSMVRVRYWNDIERGKIPRKSKAGKFLLYSVEVGIDEAHLGTDVGMRDWVCIEEKLNHYPLEMKVLQYWEDNTPNHWLFQGPSDLLNRKECHREERLVYILTSFIAAHESAERKIHGFLQVDGEDDYLGLQSKEELQVIGESKIAVRAHLCKISPALLTSAYFLTY